MQRNKTNIGLIKKCVHTAPVMAAVLISMALVACEPQPIDAGWGPPRGVFVVTTDYTTGSFSVIDPDSMASHNDVGPHMIHSDAVVRYFSTMPDYVYIVNRLGQDNIQALDRNDNYSTVYQESVGTGANPHDIQVVDSSRAYVTRYEESHLWIIDPATGNKTGDIDLSPYADDTVPGIPHMSRLHHHDGLQRLFVAVQRLASDWHPSEYSSVIVIDTDETSPDYNTVIAEIHLSWTDGSDTLNATNPYTRFRHVPASWWQPSPADGHEHIFISCVGETGYFFQLDCGIVAIDVYDMECEQGYILSEITANMEITEFVIKSGTEGYATTSDQNFKSSLIKFNPQDGTVTATIRNDNGNWGHLLTLGLGSSGILYLCDRNALDPGVRLYDTNANDIELNSGRPVYVGLPPFDLAIIEPTSP